MGAIEIKIENCLIQKIQKTDFSGIQIATKDSLFSNWAPTSPNEFNKLLVEKNKSNDNLIKPLVRLLKYWNACNQYPFESFKLENLVVDHWTFSTWLFNPCLWKRFRDFMARMIADTNRQRCAIERANNIISEVRNLELQGQIDPAERKLRRLLPTIS